MLQVIADTEIHARIGSHSVDVYIPEWKLAVEYQGEQHFQQSWRGDLKRYNSCKMKIHSSKSTAKGQEQANGMRATTDHIGDSESPMECNLVSVKSNHQKFKAR